MKRSVLRQISLAMAAIAAGVFPSCELLGPGASPDEEGQLRIAFEESQDFMTRTLPEIPDTSDFLLKVCDADGKVIYEGQYGDSPEAIMVKPGNYTVSVVSEKFTKPAFSKPQFGDEQCVMVPSGGVANVRLSCSQVNCGIRLKISPEFLDRCPDGVLFLHSSQGKLMYGYSEKRVAYFSPGSITLVLNKGGEEDVLMSRNLEAQQILVLGVTVSDSWPDDESGMSGREHISVSVDTSRIWISDSCVIGGDTDKGSGTSDALTVNQAMSSVGEEDVWVSGYVVGGDLTSSSASFTAPFSSKTCLLLGPRSSTTDRSSCISVQLPSGDVREELNLVDNPEILGRKVLLRGDIVESYYGLIGLKNCTGYDFP